jgi:hypothetical protein
MKTVSAVHISDTDNCVTLTGPVEAGDEVCFFEDLSGTVIALETVPVWHKLAIRPVEKGGVIGVALRDIRVGEHVHIHNIASPETGEPR